MEGTNKISWKTHSIGTLDDNVDKKIALIYNGYRDNHYAKNA